MDYTKTADEVLVALINAKNPPRNFTVAQLTFGAVTSKGGKATEITATSVPGSGYTGSKLFTYGRLNLADVIATGSEVVELEDKTLLSEVVAVLNTRFSLNLVAGTDYTDGALPTFTGTPGEEQEVTLAILPGSKLFIGSATLVVTNSEVALEDAAPQGDLGDLEYP